MRRQAKTDANQAEIVEALRKFGCSVETLHPVGQGVPDLMVGYRGVNLLFEVKAKLKGRLTPQQHVWHAEWRGQVTVVHSAEDALEVLEGVE